MTMKRSAGFTLAEMMVVLFIIGLIFAMIGPGILKKLAGSKVTASQQVLTAIKGAILEYQMEVGGYPKTLEHLVKNVDNNPKWRGPYLEGKKEVPLDSWDHAVMFNQPPKVFTKEYRYFEILSYGEKGENAEPSEYLHSGS